MNDDDELRIHSVLTNSHLGHWTLIQSSWTLDIDTVILDIASLYAALHSSSEQKHSMSTALWMRAPELV